MARPREFNETAVLDAAVGCFWEHGYEATSVRDLADRMGLTGASLYNAFGDKRSLFRRGLQHYVEHNTANRIAGFEAQFPPCKALRAFFEDIVERSLADPMRRGCFLVNSALDVAPHDKEFARAVADGLRLLEDFFGRCVRAGQADGTISRLHSPEDLARLMLATLLGLRVLARSRPERELLEGLVRPVFALVNAIDAESRADSHDS